MTEESLIEMGYIQVTTQKDTWGYDWILQEVGWWDLRKFFLKKDDLSKVNYFYEFGKQLYLKNQLELIWTWLETDLLVKMNGIRKRKIILTASLFKIKGAGGLGQIWKNQKRVN